MIKGCTNFYKQEEIHSFNAFFNAESIDFFVSSISYTVLEIIFKNTKKWFYKKPYV